MRETTTSIVSSEKVGLCLLVLGMTFMMSFSYIDMIA